MYNVYYALIIIICSHANRKFNNNSTIHVFRLQILYSFRLLYVTISIYSECYNIMCTSFVSAYHLPSCSLCLLNIEYSVNVLRSWFRLWIASNNSSYYLFDNDQWSQSSRNIFAFLFDWNSKFKKKKINDLTSVECKYWRRSWVPLHSHLWKNEQNPLVRRSFSYFGVSCTIWK